MRLLLVISVAMLWGTCFAAKIGRLPKDCVEPNNLKADSKNCIGIEERWYLSMISGWCKPYKYSNCSTVIYGFPSEAACKRKCEKKTGHSPQCNDKPYQERCRASFTKFYWTEQQGCKMYTGCYRRGFATLEDCRKKCGNGYRPVGPFRPGSGIRPKLGV
ncbi:actinia tenebrosa protease inhibitors-like [Dermacentor variabilis]|uniref:actinia tenebrosa protease inhibitors-like n=1 Tax=Dermacentor variabilis TaxID=34621 RepID=UPI003F5C39F4